MSQPFLTHMTPILSTSQSPVPARTAAAVFTAVMLLRELGRLEAAAASPYSILAFILSL